MKRIFLIFFVCAFSADLCLAQESGSGSVVGMLDVSLAGLKKSYQKLVDQNRLLSSQIETYRSRIPSLRKELDSSESRRKQLLALSQAGADQSQPNVYRQQIEELKQKINAISEGASERALEQERKKMQTEMEQGRNDLTAARLDAQRIKKESAESAMTISQLKARRARLERQISSDQAVREREAAKAYARGLDKEIAKLKLRQRKLERNLAGGHEDAENDISKSTEESYQLRRKFTALEYENLYLKKELSRHRFDN